MEIDYRSDNTIIFTIARMNPPTPGHLSLIQKLLETGVEKNQKEVYIILSNTNDNNENPISCSEKINVLGKMDNDSKNMINSLKNKIIDETENVEKRKQIENIHIKLICIPESSNKNIFTIVNEIFLQKRKIKDINIILVIGDDRKNLLDSTYNFLSKNPNMHSLDGIIMEREDMGKYKKLSSDPDALKIVDIQSVPTKAISASFVRNIVKYDLYDKFEELYRPYLDDNKIKTLYEKIKIGLHLPDAQKKSEKENPLKYKYPKINENNSFNFITGIMSDLKKEFPELNIIYDSTEKIQSEINKKYTYIYGYQCEDATKCECFGLKIFSDYINVDHIKYANGSDCKLSGNDILTRLNRVFWKLKSKKITLYDVATLNVTNNPEHKIKMWIFNILLHGQSWYNRHFYKQRTYDTDMKFNDIFRKKTFTPVLIQQINRKFNSLVVDKNTTFEEFAKRADAIWKNKETTNENRKLWYNAYIIMENYIIKNKKLKYEYFTLELTEPPIQQISEIKISEKSPSKRKTIKRSLEKEEEIPTPSSNSRTKRQRYSGGKKYTIKRKINTNKYYGNK